MNLLLDAPDQEFWLDETNRGNSIVPAFANAYIWATTNHRVAFSEPYILSHGNPYGKDSFPPHPKFRDLIVYFHLFYPRNFAAFGSGAGSFSCATRGPVRCGMPVINPS